MKLEGKNDSNQLVRCSTTRKKWFLIDWNDVSAREKGEMTEEKWFESIEKMPEDKRKMKLERNKTWLRIIKF
jgi:hypothetical protein